MEWNLVTDEIELSDQIIEMFGLDPGKTWVTPEFVAQVTHPEDMDYVRENLELAAKGKSSMTSTIVLSDPTGGCSGSMPRPT